MGYFRRGNKSSLREVSMAKVVWEEEAERVFEQYVENAYIEFGKSTASRWLEERVAKEWRLAHFPDSYPPEELLNGKKKFYRRCHLMNRRFKMLYYYEDLLLCWHIVPLQ